MEEKYDVIVIGAGHAGSEAAAAAGNLGARTLLITMDMTKIAQMSCNPAMGGIAKGQIVREIDALGGYSGLITDRSSIQFRMLNKSKGPAMWSPRAQCDRFLFTSEWRKALETIKNVEFWQDTVKSLLFKNNSVVGVRTRMGVEFYGRTVVLTAGTFQNGLMHIGKFNIKGGRASEPASTGLSDQLKEFGFGTYRMKTGTPARIDGRSIDFSELQEQIGEEKGKFTYLSEEPKIRDRRSCFITYTNNKTHQILKEGFEDSPLFGGIIQGIGPRYCPSIEDKIVTFAEKDRHLLFLEPEGVDTVEYYINGFSSSLPWEIQRKALKSIKGLENVKIFRPGYAIEYDYYDPTQLMHTLETKLVKNLYFAGQVNGTTGYEEAGAQGMVAGINAAFKAMAKRDEFVLNRDEAYIGVLIDDLVTKGVDEPYRMFTSRAEYRILLRQDNADYRLTDKAYKIGLAHEKRKKRKDEKYNEVKGIINICEKESIGPDQINNFLKRKNCKEINQKTKLVNLILRPEIRIEDIAGSTIDLKNKLMEIDHSRKNEIIEAAEIGIKYRGYIEREKVVADKLGRLEGIKLNGELNYEQFQSISTEARQKLNRIKPKTIGQASRISGVSPNDINILLLHMGR